MRVCEVTTAPCSLSSAYLRLLRELPGLFARATALPPLLLSHGLDSPQMTVSASFRIGLGILFYILAYHDLCTLFFVLVVFVLTRWWEERWGRKYTTFDVEERTRKRLRRLSGDLVTRLRFWCFLVLSFFYLLLRFWWWYVLRNL